MNHSHDKTTDGGTVLAAEPYEDPLVDEVRQRRSELYASLGGSLENLIEAIRRLQREHPEKVGRPLSCTVPRPESANPD